MSCPLPKPPKETRAFVTGSRAYGKPRPDSDIDLCVLIDGNAWNVVEQEARRQNLPIGSNHDGTHYSLMFGSLNLLAFDDPKEFEAWRAATEEMLDIRTNWETGRPVTREEAIKTIDKHLERIGIHRDHENKEKASDPVRSTTES